jgi:hypothetical protein
MDVSNAELKSEITTDPVTMGYSGQSSGTRARIINAPTRVGNRPTTYGAVRTWATELGILIRTYRRAEDALESDEQLASICLSFLSAPEDEVLDTNDQVIIGMVGYLHSLGFFGTASGDMDAANDTRRDELLALGGPDVSRAEELWGIGAGVSHSQISEAMS